MILKNTIRFFLGLFLLTAIGCEEAPDENLTKSNDTILLTTVVDVKMNKKQEVTSDSIRDIDETPITHGSIPAAPGVVSTSAYTEDVHRMARTGDVYILNGAEVVGDILTLTVSYRGGCETHEFNLLVNGSFVGPDPVRLDASLAHNANGDPCGEWLTGDCQFDLTPIKATYQNVRQQESGRIILRLRDEPNELVNIVYEFSW